METIELHKHYPQLFSNTFSTVTAHAPYCNRVGNVVTVKNRGLTMGQATVVAVRTFPFSKINDNLSFLETGKPAAYLAEVLRRQHGNKVYADTQLDHVVLKYTKRDLVNHRMLLEEWWGTIQRVESDQHLNEFLAQ